ncbi:MAG: enolase C-terminal domain-like protein [bacterium]
MLHEYDEALRVGKVMDELDYYWYESPMPESDEYIAQYIELKKHIRTPLIGGETAPDAHEKRFEWLHAGATDWGRLDIFNGGLTSCFLVTIECEKMGLPMDLHCAMYPHINVFAATSEDLIPFVGGYGVPLWTNPDAKGYLPISDHIGVGDEPDLDFVTYNPIDWVC